MASRTRDFPVHDKGKEWLQEWGGGWKGGGSGGMWQV